MIKPSDPKQLALDLIPRSICSVQVAAVIRDANGRFVSWAWNSVGSGLGEHAEAAAIRRANRKRLVGATIYVAAQRQRNAKPLNSYPCERCMSLLKKVGIVRWEYTLGGGMWGADYE